MLVNIKQSIHKYWLFFLTFIYVFNSYNILGDNMQVKLFDFESEKDLEQAINDFLDDDIEVVDIKYQVSTSIFSEEQIYCFSAMIIYSKKQCVWWF